MRSRILILLIAALALVVVAAGCGGGGGGNNSGKKQQGSAAKSKKQQASKGAKKKAEKAKKSVGGQTAGRSIKGGVPGTKALKGTVTAVNPAKKFFSAKPKGGPPLPFKYTPKLNVKLDGKKASVQEIKKGQKVTVRFLTRKSKKGKEFNLARALRLTSGGAVPGGATGGTTG